MMIVNCFLISHFILLLLHLLIYYSSYLYPLEEVDWVRGSGMGAIEWIVDKRHKKMLTGNRIHQLLHVKWEAFAGRIFLRRFLQASAALVLFTVLILIDRKSLSSITYRSLYAIGDNLLLAGACCITINNDKRER